MLNKTPESQPISRSFRSQTNNVMAFFLLLLLLCGSISCTAVKPVPLGIKFDSHIYSTGNGDNFNQTWAADDNIYFNCDDGRGWNQQEPATDYNCRVYKITGGPEPFDVHFLDGYPNYLRDKKRTHGDELLAQLEKFKEFYKHRWYAFGIISVDGILYHFISRTGGGFDTLWRGTKLVYSPDMGKTWYRHDGKNSLYDFVSDEGMFFWDETEDYSFSYNAFLQCGKDYSLAKDNFVYIYSKAGSGRPAEIVLARVPKDKILNKSAYTYFKEFNKAGKPVWTSDIEQKGVMHNMPKRYLHCGWFPDVVYNPGLDLYIMVAAARGRDGTNRWKYPSSLGMWYAEKPWGPFKQFFFLDEWITIDPKARLYQPKLSPKWISEDGTEMYLVFSDCQDHWKKNYGWNQQKITLELSK